MPKRDSREFKIEDALEQLVDEVAPLAQHPGIWIRDVILPEWSLDISKLSRAIGVNRANLSEVLSGKRDVSRELAYRLGALMNNHVCDLVIAYQHAWDLQQEAGRRDELRQTIARLPEPA